MLNLRCLTRFHLLAALLMGIAITPLAIADNASTGFVKQMRLGDGRVVTISEGPMEPRSLGSFSVRLYSGVNPDFPLDEYIDGRVYPRDGTIQAVRLVEELPYLLQLEFRSAGSGAYRNDWQCGFVDNRVFCQPFFNAADKDD